MGPAAVGGLQPKEGGAHLGGIGLRSTSKSLGRGAQHVLDEPWRAGLVRQSPQAQSGLCSVMPRNPRTAPSWVLLLRLLALLRPPGMVEACSCAPAHPQQHICHSALGESRGWRGPQQRVVVWVCYGAEVSCRPGVWREREIKCCTSYLPLGLMGRAELVPQQPCKRKAWLTCKEMKETPIATPSPLPMAITQGLEQQVTGSSPGSGYSELLDAGTGRQKPQRTGLSL